MRFTEGDIEYLRSLNIFDEAFFEYLRNFKFTGTLYSVPEGTPAVSYTHLDVYKRQVFQLCSINNNRENII